MSSIQLGFHGIFNTHLLSVPYIVVTHVGLQIPVSQVRDHFNIFKCLIPVVLLILKNLFRVGNRQKRSPWEHYFETYNIPPLVMFALSDASKIRLFHLIARVIGSGDMF